MERIEKDWSELDAEAVDFESGEWSWGRGGHPLQDHEYGVTHVNEEMVQTRYKAPPFINEMLRVQEKCTAESTRRDIRSALGI